MTIGDLKLAREKLHPNNLEAGLPGREDHSDRLYNFIFERLKKRKTAGEKRARVESGKVANIRGRHNNKTIFVCGVPGTGKTATVNCVLDNLERLMKKGSSSEIYKFARMYINGQHLATPEKIYSEILSKLTKERFNPERAQEKLNRIFYSDINTTDTNDNKTRRRSNRHTKNLDDYLVIVIDELDLLYKENKQNIFYSLFDWPTSAESKVILIAIANAMDLPERFMKRTGSRLGWEKIVFESYTSNCLRGILRARLGPTLLDKCFSKDAIALATGRIGRSTGDARRILDTCRLAIDIAMEKDKKVTSAEINRVGFQNLDKQRSDYLQNCPPMNLMTLQSIIQAIESVGEENVTAYNVLKYLEERVEKRFEGLYMVGHNDFLRVLTSLAGVGLIHMDTSKPFLRREIILVDNTESFIDAVKIAQVS